MGHFEKISSQARFFGDPILQAATLRLLVARMRFNDPAFSFTTDYLFRVGSMDLATAFLENETWLRTIIVARIGDQTAAEDVLQEVSVAAVRGSKRCLAIKQIRAWLYQIAVKQVLLFRRNEARRRQKVERYVQLGIATQFASSPSVEEVPSEEVAAVNHALLTLRPTDRQVLLMKYSDGLNCRQIAERLGVKETTIQSRLLRARRRMKEILVQQDIFEEFRYA